MKIKRRRIFAEVLGMNSASKKMAYDPIAELVRVNPVASIIVDMETLQIALANEASARLLGYAHETEMEGRAITELVPPEDVMAVERAAEEPPPEGETCWRCFRKDGSILYVKIKYRETVYQSRRARFVVVVESRLTPFSD
jgi:PAS domain S-box-containing protein